MITVTGEEVRRLLDPSKVIDALEDAFRRRFPTTVMPVRTQIATEAGIFLMMPCYDRAGRGLGMKVLMVCDRRSDPQGSIHANYLLMDPANGAPTHFMAANYLTDIRTAAASALATKYMARPDVRVLGVFGTGRQARAHLRVLSLVRRFENFLVSGMDPGQSREFASEMAKELNAPVEAVYSRACASESDVLCTCTTSPTPVFDGSLLRRGTHINAVGSFQPHTREIDDVTVRHARIVVDTYEGVLAEAGDVLIPMRNGLITRASLLSDLHQLVSGRRKIRQGNDDITLFKSVGNALEDLVAAELVAGSVTPP